MGLAGKHIGPGLQTWSGPSILPIVSSNCFVCDDSQFLKRFKFLKRLLKISGLCSVHRILTIMLSETMKL